MDLKQIEYFVRVAELGSFTRASVVLDIAQPALSRQVRLLEVELRQNLLVRNGRGATPTEAGKLLLEHGRGILHQVERAREELGRVRGALAGRVAIGLPPSIAKVLTVPLTRAFRVKMPDAALAISEGLSVAMRESLTTGLLDIALLYNTTPAPGIETTALLEEDLFLVQRRAPGQSEAEADALARTPLPLDELPRFPLVIPTRPNSIRMLVESELAARGKRPQISLEIDGVAAILDLVADGAGCAVLPMNAVTTSGKSEVFSTRPIHGAGSDGDGKEEGGSTRLRSKLFMAVSSQRPATLTQQAMAELIRTTLQALYRSPELLRGIPATGDGTLAAGRPLLGASGIAPRQFHRRVAIRRLSPLQARRTNYPTPGPHSPASARPWAGRERRLRGPGRPPTAAWRRWPRPSVASCRPRAPCGPIRASLRRGAGRAARRG